MTRAVWMTPAHLHGAMIAVLALLAAGSALADPAQRVVAAGGSAAEIVHALGAGDRLVARDTTSSHPPEVTALPDIGYVRRLSAENLIAMDPGLVLAEHDAGPPEALEVLRAAGVDLVMLPQATDPAGVIDKIMVTATALDLPDQGRALADRVTARLDQAKAAADAMTTRPRVMFILSMQGGRVMASGLGTSADAMIGLAGGVNAVPGFDGYKPLTDEAVLAAAPDVILMMDRDGDHAAGVAQVAGHPALAATPAAQAGRLVRMDGLFLLGFGPRTGDAALDLNAALRAAMAQDAG